MIRTKMAIWAVMAFLLAPALAKAQQKGMIELKSIAEVEVAEINAKGEKEVKRVDVSKSKVVPGDVLVYTTSYRNNGKKPAENIAITNPVPAHMNYVEGTAEGKGTRIDFSVDHGKTYGTPEALTVTDARGNKRKAGARDYTDLRWTVLKPLPPGGEGSVSFKAKLQ